MSKETPETELQVSSAQDFKKHASSRNEGKLVELPSGLVVRLGRPSIARMLKDGKLPTDVAAVLVNRDMSKPQQNIKDFPKLYEFQQYIAIAAIQEPKLVDDPREGVTVDDLDDSDLSFILQFVQTGVTDLQSFRGERSSDLAGSTVS